MKAWLGRAAATTVPGGGEHARRGWWSRWFRRGGPVPDDAFQGPDQPYPRHWRHFPDPWPPVSGSDRAVRDRLRRALDELPATWRAVVRGRDIAGRDGDDVATELGITVEQQRAILNQARAALRGRLADLLSRPGRR
jgi:DNA-directed RNA polymerase specialized sigma24 family protein